MVNSNLHAIPTAELILELQARGIDMTSAIEQIQAERKPVERAVALEEGVVERIARSRLKEKGKVILFPKSKTG